MIVHQVFISNNIATNSSGIEDFLSMPPVIDYLSDIMPDDSLISATISYEDAFLDYKEVEVFLGRISNRLVFSIAKNKIMLPHPDVTFVPSVVDGEPELKIAVEPGRMEEIGMDKLQKYFDDHLEFAQVVLGHFAWFAELNSKNELKEFIEQKRVYH